MNLSASLTDSGAFGNLQYIYSNRLSFGKVRSEEDVIWSFAPHDISMILSLAGQEPDSVRTESVSILQADIADTATVHMAFNVGFEGSYLGVLATSIQRAKAGFDR